MQERTVKGRSVCYSFLKLEKAGFKNIQPELQLCDHGVQCKYIRETFLTHLYQLSIL